MDRKDTRSVFNAVRVQHYVSLDKHQRMTDV
jgi:hypothetical protein